MIKIDIDALYSDNNLSYQQVQRRIITKILSNIEQFYICTGEVCTGVLVGDILLEYILDMSGFLLNSNTYFTYKHNTKYPTPIGRLSNIDIYPDTNNTVGLMSLKCLKILMI